MTLNFNNLEIFIQPNYQRMSIEMWIIENDLGKQFNISYNGDGLIERTEINQISPLNEEGKLKPFLNLPTQFAKGLFKIIAEYNDKNGIKTVDQNLLEGKLLAKEEHLKDMQEITKKLLDTYVMQVNHKAP